MRESLAETAAGGASRKWLADTTLGRMSIRVTTPVRVVIVALCLVGVLAAVGRTVIAVLQQPRDASGFTAIERVVAGEIIIRRARSQRVPMRAAAVARNSR